MLNISIKQFLLFSFIGLVVIACENDSSNPVAPEEHVDAEGLVLEHDGVEFYREFEGEVLVNNLTLNSGDDLELSVHFLDHDGNEIEHEDEEHEGEEDELSFTNYNQSIISFILGSHDEDHSGEEHCDEIVEQSVCEASDHCEWHVDEGSCEDGDDDHGDDEHGDEEHHELEFELMGISPGTTTFTLSLMHEGHADYISLPISVTVE